MGLRGGGEMESIVEETYGPICLRLRHQNA